MRRGDVVAVLAAVLILAFVAFWPTPTPPRTPRMAAEVASAYRYAAWCGGVVQVEPLFGGGHDVVVVGCDQ